MFQVSLHHERLHDRPEQYRKEAALHAQAKAAQPHSGILRPVLAGALRRLADMIEPNPIYPMHSTQRSQP